MTIRKILVFAPAEEVIKRYVKKIGENQEIVHGGQIILFEPLCNVVAVDMAAFGELVDGGDTVF